MPITMNAALAWSHGKPRAASMPGHQPGHDVAGGGPLHTAHVYFSLDRAQAGASRHRLREWAEHHLASAHQPAPGAARWRRQANGGFGHPRTQTGAFVHLALSARGCQALGVQAEALAQPRLGNWQPPRPDLHGLVIVGHDTAGVTAALTASLRELIHDAGGTVVHVVRGGDAELAAA